jgi:hypothetical protein
MLLDVTSAADWWVSNHAKSFLSQKGYTLKSISAHGYVDRREMNPWIWKRAESWHVGRHSFRNGYSNVLNVRFWVVNGWSAFGTSH